MQKCVLYSKIIFLCSSKQRKCVASNHFLIAVHIAFLRDCRQRQIKCATFRNVFGCDMYGIQLSNHMPEILIACCSTPPIAANSTQIVAVAVARHFTECKAKAISWSKERTRFTLRNPSKLPTK